MVVSPTSVGSNISEQFSVMLVCVVQRGAHDLGRLGLLGWDDPLSIVLHSSQ